MDPIIVGTAFITFLTEVSAKLAERFGANLPSVVKQGIALVLATGLVTFKFIVVATPLPDYIDQVLTGLSVYFLSMILHDKALKPAG